jgi:hypothetical protein
MSDDDDDGDFDEDFHICDDSMAEEFVNDAWVHMSEKDIVYLRYVYLRRFVKKDLDSSQKIIDAMYDMKGGAKKIDDISDPIMRMFLRFMELVDSVHDYDSERQVQLLMQVLHITETDFPWVLVENGKGVVSKVQLTIADVLSYDDLMTKLTCTTSIYFGDLQMESPFWKLDYRPLVFYPPKHPVTVEEMFSRLHDHRSSLNPVAPVQIPQFDEKYTAQQYIAIIRRFMAKPVDTKRQDVNMRSHFECTEVIARKEEPFTIIQKIQQIADTCDTMRHKFGGDACFMADANQPLAKFLLSYRLIDRKIFKKLKLEAFVEAIPEIKKYMCQDWRSLACDASLLDGAGHNEIDALLKKQTGNVFNKDAAVQVHLGGCQGPEPYNFQQTSYEYTAISPNIQDKSRTILGPNGEVLDEMNLTKEVKNKKWNKQHEVYSNGIVATSMSGCFSKDGSLKSLKDTEYITRWLALKRAGDWGQVEHCQANGIVFVTHDRFAFMYAVLRDVPAILFVGSSCHGCFVYSYVMYSSTRGRDNLKSFDDILKADREPEMIGGASLAYIPLIVTTVAMAFVGSW